MIFQRQPIVDAISITKKEIIPIKKKQTMKAAQPPSNRFGGIMEKTKRHGMVHKWTNASQHVTSSIWSYSSITGPNSNDYLN